MLCFCYICAAGAKGPQWARSACARPKVARASEARQLYLTLLTRHTKKPGTGQTIKLATKQTIKLATRQTIKLATRQTIELATGQTIQLAARQTKHSLARQTKNAKHNTAELHWKTTSEGGIPLVQLQGWDGDVQ